MVLDVSLFTDGVDQLAEVIDTVVTDIRPGLLGNTRPADSSISTLDAFSDITGQLGIVHLKGTASEAVQYCLKEKAGLLPGPGLRGKHVFKAFFKKTRLQLHLCADR